MTVEVKPTEEGMENWDAIWNRIVGSNGEEATEGTLPVPEPEKEKKEEGKDVAKNALAQAENENTPSPAIEAKQEEQPFRFEEGKLYPIPGKDGIEWVPFIKFKRYVEQGRGAAKIVEEFKEKEKKLATAIAIKESIVDVPEDKHEELFAQIRAAADKFRESIGLQPEKKEVKAVIPDEYKKLLDEIQTEREQRKAQVETEKVLTKVQNNVIEVVKFAKENFAIDIDEALGEQIRLAANKQADAFGIPLEQVDLVGVFTRLVPAHLKANIKNQMELEGKTAGAVKPVVAPKNVPSPRASAKQRKKLEEYSQDELDAMSKDERESLVHEHLIGTLGK